MLPTVMPACPRAPARLDPAAAFRLELRILSEPRVGELSRNIKLQDAAPTDHVVVYV